MGLPSGNRWAASNLDANGPYYFQQSPFQYESSFFSWGNVTPHNPISETEFDYDFGSANSSAPFYEGQPYGDTPGSLLTGDIPLSHDAARQMLGSPWRIPARKDFLELLEYCIYIDADGHEVIATKTDKRVLVNGILGIYLQSKINGSRLFFPCSGIGSDRKWINKPTFGEYWSSTWRSVANAANLFISSGGVTADRVNNRRSWGTPIRPIWNPNEKRK